jgi:xylulokinase
MADRPSSVLVLPHLGGSRVAFNDPDATGALIGLTFGTRRADVVRALLDGVAYEIAALHDRFTENAISLSSLLATGGGSRSRAWMQITADATGTIIRSTATADAAAYGAARLASLARAEETEMPVLQPRETFEPRHNWAEYHARRRQAFVAAVDALRRAREDVSATANPLG